jgi:hypothetical protein
VSTGGIGFVSDPRRLNVAITRPRFALLVVGNRRALRADSHWSSFIASIEAKSGLANIDNCDWMKAVQKRWKREDDTARNLDDATMVSLFEGKDCLWKISFSDDFRRTFPGLNVKIRKSIVCELMLLGQGQWRRPNMYRSNLVRCIEYVQIVRVSSLDSAGCLLWTLDVKQQGAFLVQYIKVWAAVPRADLTKWISRVEKELSSYSPSRLEKCLAYDALPVAPLQWPRTEGFSWTVAKDQITTSDISSLVVEKSDTPSHTKFYHLSSEIARMLIDAEHDAVIELLHEVSADEDALISHPGTLFILGRSGTGMLYIC